MSGGKAAVFFFCYYYQLGQEDLEACGIRYESKQEDRDSLREI